MYILIGLILGLILTGLMALTHPNTMQWVYIKSNWEKWDYTNTELGMGQVGQVGILSLLKSESGGHK